METKDIIAKIRKENHLTQTQFGEILNCDRYRVADIERGKTAPTIADIKAISNKFNVSADYLIGLSNGSTINDDVKKISQFTGLEEEVILNLVSLKNRDNYTRMAFNLLFNDNKMDFILMENLFSSMSKYIIHLVYVQKYDLNVLMENKSNEYPMLAKMEYQDYINTMKVLRANLLDSFKEIILEIPEILLPKDDIKEEITTLSFVKDECSVAETIRHNDEVFNQINSELYTLKVDTNTELAATIKFYEEKIKKTKELIDLYNSYKSQNLTTNDNNK